MVPSQSFVPASPTAIRSLSAYLCPSPSPATSSRHKKSVSTAAFPSDQVKRQSVPSQVWLLMWLECLCCPWSISWVLRPSVIVTRRKVFMKIAGLSGMGPYACKGLRELTGLFLPLYLLPCKDTETVPTIKDTPGTEPIPPSSLDVVPFKAVRIKSPFFLM